MRVGSLCLVGIGIAIAAVLHVGSAPVPVRYTISVQGPTILKRGAPVEIRGVLVGEVVERRVSGTAAEFGVEMHREYAGYPIPADSVAYLRKDGLLAPQGVHIELGKSNERLKSGDRLLTETR
jgi:ABC-type transporter Mla subunit MlaD